VETKRVVVILVGHDGVIPSLQHAIHLFRDWEHSIQTYWRDAAGGVVDLSFTFFGPYPISVPAIARNADGACPRSLVIDRARTAAQDSGVELGGYDATVVMMHPAVHTTINGETFRYDVGSSGTRCLLPVWEDFTYFCHEVGHTIGFDHSYGIPNTGADWDGALNGWMFSPVYGDPYDLMSSASFGGATSSFNLPTAAMGYAGSQRGGPLLARAQLHFAKAAHYDATGRTVHQNESATQAVDLVPAGLGAPGRPELLVWHPDGEGGDGTGRIYVELRATTHRPDATFWDSAFDAPGASRRGVVVHFIAPPAGTSAQVWYGARLIFPSPDVDATVQTPLGLFTVSVSDSQQPLGSSVRVRVSRGSRRPNVSITEETKYDTVVESSEMRQHPDWPMLGPFTWETRRTTRTTVYTPLVSGVGLGFPGLLSPATDVNIWWTANVVMVPSGATTLGVPGAAHLSTTNDVDTGVLTMRNDPADGTVSVTLRAAVHDRNPNGPGGELTQREAYFDVNGRSEGWGEDYQRFLDFLDHLNNPIPRVRLDPRPDPGPLRALRRHLLERFELLTDLRPELAEQFLPLVDARRNVLDAEIADVELRLRSNTWLAGRRLGPVLQPDG